MSAPHPGDGPLRILVVNWQDRTNPHAGGAEIHLHEIFGRLAGAGHSVSLLCNRGQGQLREEVLDGMRVQRVGGRNTFNYHAPLAYRRHFRGRVDVVVDALNKLPLLTPLYCAEPVLAIVHHLFGATAVEEVTTPAAAYVGFFESMIPRVYRGCTFEVISDSTREDLHARGVPDERIETVFCGLDHERYVPAADPRAARDEAPTLLFLGRIKRYKSVGTLVRALPRIREHVPGARAVIAGGGSDVDRLRGLAESLGMGPDVVEFPGVVSEQAKVRLYQGAHAVVMPSPKEGWGLTVVEASACGTPVLAADSPGLRESVSDGSTGWLFPFGDEEALARRAVGLLGDPEERERMGAAGVRWADRFRWEVAADETCALLRRALTGGRAVPAR